MSRSSQRLGFSLVEMLVVILIIAVLAALLFPAVSRAVESVNNVRCKHNLHQIGLALREYHDDNGSFPPAIADSPGEKYRYMSWMARILPYVEQSTLWNLTDAQAERELPLGQFGWPFPNPWDNANYPALATPMSLYTCTSDPRGPSVKTLSDGLTIAFTGYLGVSGTTSNAGDGTLYQDSHTRLVDLDAKGGSNTIIVGERPPSADLYFGWWFAGWGQDGSGSCDVVLGSREPFIGIFFNPVGADGTQCVPGMVYPYGPGQLPNPCDQLHYWSFHFGGTNFLMADGSVHFIPYTVGGPVLDALATRFDTGTVVNY